MIGAGGHSPRRRLDAASIDTPDPLSMVPPCDPYYLLRADFVPQNPHARARRIFHGNALGPNPDELPPTLIWDTPAIALAPIYAGMRQHGVGQWDLQPMPEGAVTKVLG